MFADALERVVVLLATGLEVGRQVQERLGQPVPDDEEEHDQQPSEPAVAVEERVDRLELVVQQRGLDERWQSRVLVDEALEIAQQLGRSVRRRRHERGGLDRGAGRPDPVLGGAELARLAIPPADTGEDHGVHLPDEPGTEREGVEALQAGFHRPDVVDDLLDVGVRAAVAGLGVEHVGSEACVPSMRVEATASRRRYGRTRSWGCGQQPAGAGEPTEGRLGVGEQQQVGGRDLETAGDRVREVRDVARTARPCGERRRTGCRRTAPGPRVRS